MIKKNLIFALFFLILLQSLSAAEAVGSGIDLSYNLHSGGLPASKYINNNSGSELKLSFPVSQDFRFSLGVYTYMRDSSYYDWSLFGSSNTVNDTSKINCSYFELVRVWYITDLPVEQNLYFSKAEVYAGVRYGGLSANRYYTKNYTSSSYSDDSLTLKGEGYQIALPIGIVVPFKGHDNLRLNISLTPTYSQLPLSGTYNTGRDIEEIADDISGFAMSFAFGISWEF